MNISIENKLFITAVHTVARFSERKNTTLPVLSAILIVAGDEGIKLRATNLEIAIDYSLKGVCRSKGVAAISSSVLQQIASSLPLEGTITLEQSGEVVQLSGTTGKSTIKTIPYDDFPSLPIPEHASNNLTLSGTVIRSLFSTIASCASPSTIRPELASVYLSIQGGELVAAATDSFRLIEKKIPLPSQKGTQSTILIPAKNALDIAQSLPDEDISISFNEHQCAFTTSSHTAVSRLTNAVYPDYQQIIPKESKASVTVLRKDFEQALKRVTIFSDSFQKIRLNFDSKQKRFSLFSRNTDVGESTEVIKTARIEGEPLELSFNHRYLSACFSLIPAESLTLSVSGIGRPILIKGVGDPSLLYLISPMNQ